MGGPPPKPASQRQRQSEPGKGPRRLPAGGRSGTGIPTLPGAAKLSKATREWWKRVWQSPMSSVYLDADLTGLIRLARLLDRDEKGEATATMLAEIRQLEDRFGLSPLARRRLEWEVSQSKGTEAAPAAVSGKGDPRLRSIQGGAA